MGNDIFNRTELLLGEDSLNALRNARVIIFGVGGVGSWCAEGLIRSGIGHITMVDADKVCVTNLNRQLQATTGTIGKAKVEALRERLLDINPQADIVAIQKQFSNGNYQEFELDSYDYIIDAIDSLKDKISLILRACETQATLFSSMGAALKVDPTRVSVAEFWKVRGCPLGSMLRKKMRRENTIPAKKFLCVYDEEVLPNLGAENKVADGSMSYDKVQTNGSLVHITAIFGMTISGLVVKDIHEKRKKSKNSLNSKSDSSYLPKNE